MTLFKNTTDFLVPIDIDEFISLARVNEDQSIRLSMSKELILEEFAKLPVDGRAYKFIFSLSRPLDCEDRAFSKYSSSTVCSSTSFYVPYWWQFTDEKQLAQTTDWK